MATVAKQEPLGHVGMSAAVQKPRRYAPLSVEQDLSDASLMQAMEKIGLNIFTLYVHPEAAADTSRYLNTLVQVNNPLSPRINLKVDGNLNRYEWFLQHGDMKVGSDGP